MATTMDQQSVPEPAGGWGAERRALLEAARRALEPEISRALDKLAALAGKLRTAADR